jgi:uncharacterized membrane protein
MESKASSKFSIKEAVGFGFEKAKVNLFFYIVLFLIIIAIYIAYFAIQSALDSQMGKDASLLMNLVNWVLSAVLSLGAVNIALKIVDNKKPVYKDIFFTDPKLLFVFIISNILRQIVVVVGFILLIVPGIILSIKLQYIDYLIVDKKMGFEAINKSWDMTKGVKWQLFLFGLTLALINILGFIAILLGLFITIPLSMIAAAYVYRKLLSYSK